jgi:hypothetical protein
MTLVEEDGGDQNVAIIGHEFQADGAVGSFAGLEKNREGIQPVGIVPLRQIAIGQQGSVGLVPVVNSRKDTVPARRLTLIQVADNGWNWAQPLPYPSRRPDRQR